MKRMLVAAVLLCAPAVFGASCVSGSLQSYVNLGAVGCQDGTATFSGFTTEPGINFGSPFSASLITVTPGGTFLMPTLTFTGNLTAGNNVVLESLTRFMVGGGTFTGVGVSLAGSASGFGSLTATENVCAGAAYTTAAPTTCASSPGTPIALVSPFLGNIPSDSTKFNPATVLGMFFDLTADGTSGGASLTSATVSFTATPEPATFGLIFISGAALLLRRRATQQPAVSRRNHAAI